jgi:branched-chain amino acid transport system substrate-binding protein
MHRTSALSETQGSFEESASYQKAQELYKQGKYDQAADFFQKAAMELADPEKIAGANYMIAVCNYRVGKYSDAILVGRALIDSYPASQYVDDAMLVMGKSYYKKDNFLQAAEYFIRLLSSLKDERLAPEAEKLLNYMAETKLGTNQLLKLARDFPDSQYAPMLLYHAARVEVQAGRRSRAAETVRSMEERYSGTEYYKRAAALIQSTAAVPAKRTIGLLVPLTGEYNVYGLAVQRGVNLGLDTTGFRLVTYDDKGDPIEALKGARSLIEDNDVLAVIGPVLSMPTIAAAAVANSKEVVLISPTSTERRISSIGPYVFQLNLSIQTQAEAIAEFAVSNLGLGDIAVLYPEDAYGEGVSKIFKDKVLALGGRVPATVGYEPGTTDFKQQIATLKAPAPQGVFIPAYPDDIVLIAPQLRYYEFKGTMLGAGGWLAEKVTRLGEDYVEGAVFAAVETEYGGESKGTDFETLYQSKYGSKPSRQSALGYDAIQLIQSAARDPQTTHEMLMERLSMVTSYWGASGVISLSAKDDAAGQVGLYTITKGAFKRIK